MNQPTALEIACQEKRNPVVAMHESSHIMRHERQGYQLQNASTYFQSATYFALGMLMT